MDDSIKLNTTTGPLDPEKLALILANLDVEITYIDRDDIIRYITPKEEYIFPRSQGQLGHNVMEFHKPETQERIRRMLGDFRAGKKDVEYSWREKPDSFILTTYRAVRDSAGEYAGTMEVVQDIMPFRGITETKKVE